MANVYGYIRVSSRDQNEERQLIALKRVGVAENERTNIRQRQAEGIAAAKAKGIKFGRPPLPLPDNFYEVHKDWRGKKITLKQAAIACHMPVGTFYRKARKFEDVE
ncbi:MAG: DNA recombinase [Eubacteriales bacterium]|nr:DNA recombinase [Eubacteriales bacterium]